MKALVAILSMLFFINNKAISQDIITKKSGEDISSKVLEITTEEVKFKKWDNLEGPTFSIYKSDVLIIRYKNGAKDIFTSEPKAAIVENQANHLTISDSQQNSNTNIGTLTPSNIKINYHEEGRLDAVKYYKGYSGAGTGTLVTSLFAGGILGLIPALITTSSQPQEINLNYPSHEKMANRDYYNGYVNEAFKIKKSKVWGNWGIAVGINVITYFVLTRK